MNSLRARALDLRNRLFPPPPPPTHVDIAATDVAERDQIWFTGAWFQITKVRQYGSVVEVDAVDPWGVVHLEYLPFEEVRVRLPRPRARQ